MHLPEDSMVFIGVISYSLAEKIVKTPYMADSITQGTLASWEKSKRIALSHGIEVGEYVKQDETIANIETDKVTIPVNSPESGLLCDIFAKEGETVQVGSDLFKIDPDKLPPKSEEPPKQSPKPEKSEKLDKIEKVMQKVEAPKVFEAKSARMEAPKAPAQPSKISNEVTETREKLTRMRMRIAERMKESQNTAAALTTFNEVDMSALIALRNRYKDDFLKRHGVKLGFMSPFIRASATVLRELPVVNAHLDMTHQEIVYNQNIDISVAVATPKGLVTPVLRECQQLSMVQIEKALADLSIRARDNKMSLEELTGGSFTISNGGVFGSLMGTPILNTPQSAILGMHAIKERPIVVNGQIEIRPMMYLALTYDHRLIDGREAVTFLVRLKELLEDPQRLLLDI